MSWAPVLTITCAASAVVLWGYTLIPPKRNRRRKDVIPPPADACKRLDRVWP